MIIIFDIFSGQIAVSHYLAQLRVDTTCTLPVCCSPVRPILRIANPDISWRGITHIIEGRPQFIRLSGFLGLQLGIQLCLRIDCVDIAGKAIGEPSEACSRCLTPQSTLSFDIATYGLSIHLNAYARERRYSVTLDRSLAIVSLFLPTQDALSSNYSLT